MLQASLVHRQRLVVRRHLEAVLGLAVAQHLAADWALEASHSSVHRCLERVRLHHHHQRLAAVVQRLGLETEAGMFLEVLLLYNTVQ